MLSCKQALNEIVELLSAYSESNSWEHYVTLLSGLGYVVLELKEDARQGKLRRKKKHDEVQFNRGAANIPRQDFPNVVTSSRKPLSTEDRSSLTLRSDFKPEPYVSEEEDGSNRKSIITVQPSNHESRSEMTTVGHESLSLTVNAGPATKEIGMTRREKLKEEIERCGNRYRGEYFIVNGNERSETVIPEEIDRFFSRFQEGQWLTNFNLMPLLFSFNWLSTTLVLDSSYISSVTLEDGNRRSNLRVTWPLHDNYDRVIVPCCFQSHWTLFDVDLESNIIRQYNSLAGDASTSAVVVSAIKERLTHAMVGRENRTRDFAIVSGVYDDSHSFKLFISALKVRRHLNNKRTILIAEYT